MEWDSTEHTTPWLFYDKTVGGFLLLYVAIQVSLDLDAGITTKYGVRSSKTYEVTSRMMAQVLGGDDRPGGGQVEELNCIGNGRKALIAGTPQDFGMYACMALRI